MTAADDDGPAFSGWPDSKIQLLADKVTDAMDDKVEQAFAAYQSAVKGLKDGVDEQVLALTTEVRQLASEVKLLRTSFQTLSDDMISGAILPARGPPSGSSSG